MWFWVQWTVTCQTSVCCCYTTLMWVLFVQFKEEGKELHGFHPVAVLLSYLAKAPLVPEGTPVVNALSKQRAMLENTFRACVGLYPENNMMLEFK